MAPRLLVSSDPRNRKQVFFATMARLQKYEETHFHSAWEKGLAKTLTRFIEGEPYDFKKYIDFSDPIFREYADDPPSIDIIHEYITNPNPKSAHTFLTLLKLPVPLETLVSKKKQKIWPPNMVPSSPSSPPMESYGGAEGEVSIPPSLLEAMVVTDMLHDFIHHFQENDEEKMWIWNQQSVFQHKPDSKTYTQHIGKKWIAQAKADPKRFHFISRPSARFTEAEDTILFEKLQSWAYKKDVSMIVDGIIGLGINHSKTLIQTATILMLFENGAKLLNKGVDETMRLHLTGSIESKLETLTLYNGFYEEMDSRGTNILHIQTWVSYMQKYVQKVIVRDTLTKPNTNMYIPSKYYMRTYMDTNKHVHLPSQRKVLSRKRAEWVNANGLPLWLPFSKRDLMYLMKKKIELGVVPSDLQHLRDAMDLNFFRDAYMIDMALQHGCIYFTQDRLGFIFYTLLAMENNLPLDGMYMSVHKEKQENVMYSFGMAI